MSPDWLSVRNLITPDQIALEYQGRKWSYRELSGWVDRICHHLHGRGVRPGNRVAVITPNSPIYVALIHAVAWLGIQIYPLNTRLTKMEIDIQLEMGEIDYLILGDRVGEGSVFNHSLERTIQVSLLEGLADVGDNPWVGSQVDGSDPFGVLFTSGTSGTPKGVVLTYSNLFYSAVSSGFRLGIDPMDRWLLCMPLYHMGGISILLRCCIYGTTVVLMDRFDPAAVNQALDEGDISQISLVPTMLKRVLEDRKHRKFPSSVRVVLLGGSAPLVGQVEEALASGIPIFLTYGLTEAASQVATARPADLERKPCSVGKPLFFTRVRIANTESETSPELKPIVPQGEIGEVCIAGPTVMHGYQGEPPLEGEFPTGDLGYLDADGDLFILERRTDLILSGGENVYPSEVEKVLLSHPAIIEACVVGTSDPVWGQRVSAAVVTKIDQNSILEGDIGSQLQKFCRLHLAGYKIPAIFTRLNFLPKTPSGKIKRDQVAEVIRNAVVNK